MILCTEGGGIMIVSNFSSTAVPGDGRLLSCAAPAACSQGGRAWQGQRLACRLATMAGVLGSWAGLLPPGPVGNSGRVDPGRCPRIHGRHRKLHTPPNPNGQACSLFTSTPVVPWVNSGGVTVKSHR